LSNATPTARFALLRFNDDGTFDISFGSQGLAVFDAPGDVTEMPVALAEDSGLDSLFGDGGFDAAMLDPGDEQRSIEDDVDIGLLP
jgi:hypothetical protein